MAISAETCSWYSCNKQHTSSTRQLCSAVDKTDTVKEYELSTFDFSLEIGTWRDLPQLATLHPSSHVSNPDPSLHFQTRIPKILKIAPNVRPTPTPLHNPVLWCDSVWKVSSKYTCKCGVHDGVCVCVTATLVCLTVCVCVCVYCCIGVLDGVCVCVFTATLVCLTVCVCVFTATLVCLVTVSSDTSVLTVNYFSLQVRLGRYPLTVMPTEPP